ncbi:MAG: TolC family protein, partial [Sphingomonadaceae bacterium]
MRLVSLLALAGLSACAVGPDYQMPKPVAPPQAELTEATDLAAVSDASLPDRWWRLFNNPDLDRLVESALIYNSDVRIAAANLQRARALLSESGAARLPFTSASASAARAHSAPDRGGTGDASDYYSAGFDASYEVDLFGGVSRSVEAARADVSAAGAQLDAARVAVAAETARTYSSACGFGLQAEVARTTAKLQRQTQDLTLRLFKGGSISQREVDRATVLVEQA